MSHTPTIQTDSPTPTTPRRRRRWPIVLTGLAAIGLISGIASAASGSHPAAQTAPPPATSAPAAPATKAPAPPATSEPATSAPATQAPPPAPAEPTEPAGTVSQLQALESAKSYLDMGGFSEKGLIKQLTSKYGDQFSEADAKWAVAHSGADWNAQAVMSAKSYLEMGGFSRAGLIDQLTSPYGEQFTQAQAVYAADHVGL